MSGMGEVKWDCMRCFEPRPVGCVEVRLVEWGGETVTHTQNMAMGTAYAWLENHLKRLSSDFEGNTF
ncbi:hypothetical protein pdam_00015985 [Pocillopora damicornis]|uniref:Uncharacterized protein n=1 Tax=Pocillopora damicornis TaxID=46731 RepID=A0A3M6TSE2_POCDA|nr:hypothetical protein pdam_00015985 [Pocillopora damicornis]